MDNVMALPIQQWAVRLEEVIDDEAAHAGWLSLIRAQGWSPVGESEIIRRPEFGEFAVVGKIVRHPGLVCRDDGSSAIMVARA